MERSGEEEGKRETSSLGVSAALFAHTRAERSKQPSEVSAVARPGQSSVSEWQGAPLGSLAPEVRTGASQQSPTMWNLRNLLLKPTLALRKTKPQVQTCLCPYATLGKLLPSLPLSSFICEMLPRRNALGEHETI